MRRLIPLGFAALAVLASCAPSAPPHGQDPFYLSPPDGRQPASSPAPAIGSHRGGGMMPGGVANPGDPRSDSAFPPTGGSMSFGSGGGL